MNLQYTDYKPAWHLGRIQELRDTGLTTPAQIQLIISDLCNEDCSFCAYRMSGYTSNQHFGELRLDGSINNNPKRMIDYVKCLEILDDAKELGVLAIQFTGGGEPTVHPKHLEIFAYAQALGLKTALVSNGVILRDGWQEVYSKFDWIRFSLDAGTAETYSKVRKVPAAYFERVLSNAARVAEAARNTDCIFGMSFIVTKENYQEIEDAAIAIQQTGASSIRYGAVFTPELASYYDGIGWYAALKIDAAKKHETDKFKVIGQFNQRIQDLQQGRPDYSFCGYQHLNMYIGGDLNIYRCCNTAYNDLGFVASLKEQSLAEFFESERRKRAYKFNAKACQHCAFHDKNRLINYLVNPAPMHVEFV